LSTAPAADAPLSGFERKLSTSIQRLRANSIHHERTPKSSESSKSQLYLHRLKSVNRHGGHNLSNDEALFFLSLPDKIRRLHFTAEENILMRAACELQLSKRPRHDNVRPLPLRSWTDGGASSSHSYASSSISRHTMAGPLSLPSTPTTSDGGYSSVTSSRTSSRPRTESIVSSNASVRPFNPLGCHPLGGSRATIMSQSPFDYTKVAT
ncbi:hypothetical protein KCV01_g26809, partial [Aureobasidium melanogenum]